MSLIRTIAIFVWVCGFVAAVVLSLVPDLLASSHNEDKSLHMLAYMLLVSGLVVLSRSPKLVWFVVPVFFGIGCAIEYLQSVIGGRESSVHDVLANSVGILSGFFTGFLMKSGLIKSSLSAVSVDRTAQGE